MTIKKALDKNRRPTSVPNIIGRSSMPANIYSENDLEVELQAAFERFLDNEAEKQEEEDRVLLAAEELKRKEIEEEKRKIIERKAVKEYVKKIRKDEQEMQKK